MELRELAPHQRTDALGAAIAINTQSVSWQVSHPEVGPIDRGEVSFIESFPDVAGKGFLDCGTGDVISSPMLFAQGMSEALEQIRDSARFETNAIRFLAGAGQQHGQVLANESFEPTLQNLSGDDPWEKQLRGVFARPWSSIWMNSSTGEDCQSLAEMFPGGPEEIARRTGSRPTERFFGPALRRIARMERGYYDRCRHAMLISSFGASLCLGRVAPIEQGDGAGGNLMDIRRRQWDAEILAAWREDAPGLSERLPSLVDANQRLGPVSDFLVRRYGFHAECQVLPWSGDNPDSLLGMGIFSLEQGIRVCSKGTSETEFCLLPEDVFCDPTGAGSVFGAVTGQNQNLAINTRVNGTLALERVKDCHGLEEWDDFSQALNSTPPGNAGRFMIGLYRPEIVPHAPDPIVERHGFAEDDRDAEVRAIVESTAIIKHLYNQWMGPPAKKYLATGGGSVNPAVLQVEADVAGVPFYMPSKGDSVVNGGCLRALRQIDPERYDWAYLTSEHCDPGKPIEPKNTEAYAELKPRLRAALEKAIRKG